MVSWIISRLVVLIFGTLYPAYYSYKAVKSKDIKEYVKWMMYWIIFALFTTAETFTDIFLCWFPFYYELKIAFVAWLLSPYTKGSSLLYRKFVHPTLSSKEKEIDDCLVQAKDRSYDALVHFGKRGLNVAATAAVMAASKGQGALSERLRSFSMQDLTTIRGDGAPAPSGPPPPGTGRSGGKHGQPKMSRSASESASSSEPFDPASGRKVPHPRPLKPREMSQQHRIHRCLSLLCLKELVASTWKSAGWVCFECAAPRHGLYSLPSSAFKNFLFSFLFVPAGERLKGKVVVEGDLYVFWG
uniref:receptor expression-enhancing protein 1 isoform X2 n=1 Tax=Arvicanthis niloticus TaxID=61156 RepID=UPI001485FAC9|nr:receptor expression-enhancing protein 1 isoform X2 [Arvicanthis niloticus]